MTDDLETIRVIAQQSRAALARALDVTRRQVALSKAVRKQRAWEKAAKKNANDNKPN